MSSRTFALARALCVAWACALSAACAHSPRPSASTAEAPPPPPGAAASPETAASPEAAPARELPPPGAADFRAAVERIFKGAVTIIPAREPYFAVGDFNGDGSQDLAVAVVPVPDRLGELNDELANWMVKDPFAPTHAGAAHGEARHRVLVEGDDALLAVIHGYGAEGWRDARATQTYVLKGAAGERMKTRALKAARASGGGARLPRLVGDVIDESVGGREGFLYYNGVQYLWYDPRGYKPQQPERGMHGGAVKPVRQ